MSHSETELRVVDAFDTQDRHLTLTRFIEEFGDGLLDAVQCQNPAVYSDQFDPHRESVMEGLLRQPFPAQRDVVQAVTRLLVDENQPAAVINAEMGTGKTMMAIAAAAVMHGEGYSRTLVIAPPHLVYKWRREIRETVPEARVWILNGPDTLRKLLQLRAMQRPPSVPDFFVMGRVRMRMGFNWKPAFITRKLVVGEGDDRQRVAYAACPKCGSLLTRGDDEPLPAFLAPMELNTTRRACPACGERLWTLVHRVGQSKPRADMLREALTQIPTIGDKTAHRLVSAFGEDLLSGMLEDNVFEFINLMDSDGDLFFNDRQARRMERAMASMEFAFGQGGYQPTEFIKRQLPQGYFGLLVVDEGHEYKNEGSAQGQAMGVLARKCRKTLLLTGTLMGGYADDLFYLLWRLNPRAMIEDGFGYSARSSLGPAAMQFMREHGVLKDIYKESESASHRTARGRNITHRTAKGPGFGPKGIMRYVVPCTVFLKLRDIGADVLPPYREHFEAVAMTEAQQQAYEQLTQSLKAELKDALRKGDKSLLGVVLNVLLAWPDCCFRDERVAHPHTRQQLAYVPAQFGEAEAMPKERELVELCKSEKARGRRVLVYSVYTGTRDTTSRLKATMDRHGFKTAVLKASVEAAKREDWLFEQVDRGVEVLITNPELVKTGLDMLEFPTIVFLTTGYNVYTLQQAARRSWRIGQKADVDVYFLGYRGSAQMACLELMAKKIAVSQSTSGDMPESGLDVLNQDGDSIEVALARQLVG
ncbi:MAG: DEAD/DEAH box helicase [Pseudomonadales bacterium]|nr:DEAD/DEAH box helicase [Pseudomonadales bacterium]